jgi:hypothetical protein
MDSEMFGMRISAWVGQRIPPTVGEGESMTRSKKALGLLSAAAFGVFGVHAASGTIVTQWDFNAIGVQSAPYNSPAPTTGTGTAISLGMTNSYAYSGGETSPTTTADDVLSTSGTANPSFTENLWRIRGFNNASGSPGNGWNNSAPNYTQGAEFEANLTGYAPTSLAFDWYCTSQGVANLQVQYTLDDTQASPVWVNLGGDLIATSNDYYGAAAGSPTNTISLTSLPAGATGDANFAVQLVSVKPVPGDSDYSATGPGGDGNYATAKGDTSSATAKDYNNSSGNWRFGEVTFNGTAIPEPASASLLGLAGLGLLGRRRSKVKSL